MANYTNLTALQEVTPLSLNFDNMTNPVSAVTQLQSTANSEVGNFWFIGAITILYLMFMWWFYREDKSFTYDMTRSIFISSSWCFFITVAFVLSGWITTIVPLFWFATSFTVSLVGIMKLKEKGL